MARKRTDPPAAPLDPPAADDVQVAPPPGEPPVPVHRPVREGDPIVHRPTPVAAEDAVMDTPPTALREPSTLATAAPRAYSQTAPEELVGLQRRLEAVEAENAELRVQVGALQSMIDAYNRAEAAAAAPVEAEREVTPTQSGHGPVVLDQGLKTLGGVRPPGVPE